MGLSVRLTGTMEYPADRCAYSRSFHGFAAGSDRSAPSLDLAYDEFGEIFWTASFGHRDLLAQGRKTIVHRGRIQSFADRLIEPSDDRLWRVLGQEYALPGGCDERQALLSCGWHLWQSGGAPRSRGGQHFDEISLDLRRRSRRRIAQIVDAAGNQVLHRESQAAIWHVGDVNTQGRVEQHTTDM